MEGEQSTIGMYCTPRTPVAWYLGKDTNSRFVLDNILLCLYKTIIELRKKPVLLKDSILISYDFNRTFISADLHAIRAATIIKNNKWRQDRFEQHTDDTSFYYKQSEIFCYKIHHWWDRYDSEHEWKEDNEYKGFYILLFHYIIH